MKPIKLIKYLSLLLFVVILFGCKDSNTVQPTTNNNNGNPEIPVLISPVNEATVSNLQPVLKWQSFTNAISYDVQVSLDANYSGTMLLDTSGITGTQTTLSNGLGSTGSYYYWHVRAKISGSTSPWSSSFRFRTVMAAPPVPVLQSPANGSQNQSFLPLFDWDDSPTAQIYRIQVSLNQNFQTHLVDTSVAVSQAQCPYFVLNTGTQYYWRVNATNSNGLSTSAWSSPFSFTTVSGPIPSSISGTITFVDSNFTQPADHRYYLGAFNAWPPTDNSPTYFTELNIQKNGNIYSSSYQLTRIPDGPYVLGVYYLQTINLINEPILGIYGCDTVHLQYSNCPNFPSHAVITNGNGLENYNILSWSNIMFRIF